MTRCGWQQQLCLASDVSHRAGFQGTVATRSGSWRGWGTPSVHHCPCDDRRRWCELGGLLFWLIVHAHHDSVKSWLTDNILVPIKARESKWTNTRLCFGWPCRLVAVGCVALVRGQWSVFVFRYFALDYVPGRCRCARNERCEGFPTWFMPSSSSSSPHYSPHALFCPRPLPDPRRGNLDDPRCDHGAGTGRNASKVLGVCECADAGPRGRIQLPGCEGMPLCLCQQWMHSQACRNPSEAPATRRGRS